MKTTEAKDKEAEEKRVIITGSVDKVTHDGSTTRYYVDFIYNGQLYTEKTIHYSITNGKYAKGDAIRVKYDPTGEKRLLIVDDKDLISVSSSVSHAPEILSGIGSVLFLLSLIMIIKTCI